MSNNKQSSIEWLMNELANSGLLVTKDIDNLVAYNKAKAMHKEEIENAVKQGWDYNEEGLVQWMGETYYNETFNTKEK